MFFARDGAMAGIGDLRQGTEVGWVGPTSSWLFLSSGKSHSWM